MNIKVKGYFWGCISSATFGLIPLFALPLMHKGIAHDSLLCYRFASASFLIAMFMLFRKESFRIARRELIPMAMLGILYGLSAQCLFFSYDYLGVGTASTILFIYPVFVAILMAVLFKEKISLITIAAILLAFFGVSLLYKGDHGITLNLLGLSAVLFSALCYAIYIVSVNKSRIQLMSGYKLTFYVMGFSAIFFLVKAQMTIGLQPLPDTGAIVDLALLALPATAISCVAMIFAVQYVGSTATAILGALEPVVAVAVGIFVFKEAITSNLVIGIFLILIAVLMIILSDYIYRKLWFQKSI
ncbi:drug/metabolite transporter (DMT)-like permease [Pedobacter cryoconitis]|uniref:DMT family transporter n=1 Tax=Pedobacter cryoconitis TaxID=188932 RepID=UPI00160E5377|nr:DMT family transporter [Pedobacter cryoconitis]MBB6272426.1 drug/metabolite transporter (DMT)-like permease [Pedobacter cryoconitis]